MLRSFVLAASFVAVATVASAGPLTFSVAGGDWKNATAPSGVCVDYDNQTGTLRDGLRWGGGDLVGIGSSQLLRFQEFPSFDPSPYVSGSDACWLDSYLDDLGNPQDYNWLAPVSGYNFDPFEGEYAYTGTPTPFSLGTFKHLNFPIFDGITSVEYNIQIAHNGVSPGSPFSFDLLFEHNETDNTNYPVCCDDIVTVSIPGPAVVVEFGGEQFVLELLGFFSGSGQGYANTFISPENGSNEAQLFARVTPLEREVDPQAGPVVPEPATLTLFGTGLAAVAFAVRRRRRRQSPQSR